MGLNRTLVEAKIRTFKCPVLASTMSTRMIEHAYEGLPPCLLKMQWTLQPETRIYRLKKGINSIFIKSQKIQHFRGKDKIKHDTLLVERKFSF